MKPRTAKSMELEEINVRWNEYLTGYEKVRRGVC